MYYTYIITNSTNKVMYIGVTNDLKRRIYEHKHHLLGGFTKKYHIDKLVYYEQFNDIRIAIAREKELKGWLRKRKDDLVQAKNPQWNDLSATLFPEIL